MTTDDVAAEHVTGRTDGEFDAVASATPLMLPPAPLSIGIAQVNWIGMWTLYVKEVKRFLKVFLQTIAAPAVTTLMFLAIFALALGGTMRTVGDMPFLEFLAPGLIMMAVIQNSFANTTSSIMIGKVQGNIIDVLLPPLSSGELVASYAIGGITRGVLVGLVVGLAMVPTVGLSVVNVGVTVYFLLSASLMLSLVGIMAGIWADKFDHMAAVTNFVIVPLSFLSGTFYSVKQLPEGWSGISQYNPFFYLIDGFRYGLTGRADGDIAIGIAMTLVMNCVLWLACYRLFQSGYKLKA